MYATELGLNNIDAITVRMHRRHILWLCRCVIFAYTTRSQAVARIADRTVHSVKTTDDRQTQHCSISATVSEVGLTVVLVKENYFLYCSAPFVCPWSVYMFVIKSYRYSSHELPPHGPHSALHPSVCRSVPDCPSQASASKFCHRLILLVAPTL